MKRPPSTVIEKLMQRLRDQAQRFNATLEVAPVVVLWTEERREWESAWSDCVPDMILSGVRL